MMCRFASGAMGQLYFSRVATGRKMGYAYEVTGTTGAIRFDQEDQNALWLYRAEGPEATRGFTKILTGPAHPDFRPSARDRGTAPAIRTRSSSRRATSCAPSRPASRSGRPSATAWRSTA